MNKWIAFLALAVFAAGTAPTAGAFPTQTVKKPAQMRKMPPGHMRKMPPGRMMARGMWADKVEKMCFSPAQARKMHYKCAKGHKLVHVAKCPRGYKMMGRMPAGMAPMMGNKPPMMGRKSPMMGKKTPMKGRMEPMEGKKQPMKGKGKMAPMKGM